MASPLLGKRGREQEQPSFDDWQQLQPHKRFLAAQRAELSPETTVHEISHPAQQQQDQQQQLLPHQQLLQHQQELLAHQQLQQHQQHQQHQQELLAHQQQHQHQQQPSTCTDIVLYRPITIAPEVLTANPGLLGALCGAAGSDGSSSSSSSYQLPSAAVAPDTAQLKAVWHSLTPGQRKSLRGAWAALREGGRSGSLPLRRLGSSQALPAPASCVIEELPDGSDDAPEAGPQQHWQHEAGVDVMMTDEPGGGGPAGLAPAGSVEEMEM